MSGTPPLRAAILGCGSIARRHCEAFQVCGIPVVAVADTVPEAARSLAELAGPGTALYPSAEALFEAGGFELLSICTPPLFHAARQSGHWNAICMCCARNRWRQPLPMPGKSKRRRRGVPGG